jgi:small-conductance mechanosensitive channel
VGTAWGVDVLVLSESTSLAGRAFGVAVDLVVALLIADLVWVWARTAIDARMADYVPPEPGHAPGPEARLATLLPLLRKILIVTLISMVALIGLSSLGVNIGPLLAGAGVVGIAIGFGAQALVKDVVSGIFFLVDDAFRVGEYIEVGDLRGTVESISVRSLRVRHHRGAVHTIPFGEIPSLTNYSRDWVIMKLEFRVPFETDLKLVKKIVKNVGAELQQDPELGEHILEPLKSQGVRRMEEFNMVVGVKFMAKPGEQWTIRKEAFQRIRDAFEAQGIRFAERNVKVEVVSTGRLTAEEHEAAVGAAQHAVEAQLPEDPEAAGASGGS